MSQADHEYTNLLSDVLKHGVVRTDRTGVGTTGLFGATMRFDLTDSFPLLTTKKVYWTGCVDELLWFLRGHTNVKQLPETVQQWWTPWADRDGDLGPIYGQNWRRFGHYIDQLRSVLDSLRNSPFSRRHVVTLWDPMTVHKTQLPPCHGTVIQFYVHPDSQGNPQGLSCQMYQRSADMFLGVPVNIASYALLTHLIAHDLDLVPTSFVHVLGDVHIYSNHLSAVNEQLERQPRPGPKLVIDTKMPELLKAVERTDFHKFLTLSDYNPHPSIKAPLAV